MKLEDYNVEIPQDGETWEGIGALGTTPTANAENHRIMIEPQKPMTEEEFDKWADIVVERHNTIAEAYEKGDYRRVQAELAGLGDHLSPLPLIMFLFGSPNQFKKTSKEEVKIKYAYMRNPELHDELRDAAIKEVMGDLGVKEVIYDK